MGKFVKSKIGLYSTIYVNSGSLIAFSGGNLRNTSI